MTTCSHASRPNILVVLADDVGIGDLRPYSHSAPVSLPAIEYLAAEGTRFDEAHAWPLCAPSRYSLLSGNMAVRANRGSPGWDVFDLRTAFAAGQQSIAGLLRTNGYNTAFFGKWGIAASTAHAGGRLSRTETMQTLFSKTRRLDMGPSDFGFNYSFASSAGIMDAPYAFFENGELVGESCHWSVGAHRFADGGVSVTGAGHHAEHEPRPVDQEEATPNGVLSWRSDQFDAIALNRALEFLDRHASANAVRRKGGRRPFFVEFATAAVHIPHTPPLRIAGTQIANRTLSAYNDMLLVLDFVINALLGALRRQGVLHDSLVVFLSDNGAIPCSEKRFGSLYSADRTAAACAHSSVGRDTRGFKGGAFEGGHHVPMIMMLQGTQCTRGIGRGAVDPNLVAIEDVFRTLLDFVGVAQLPGQGLDSVSFAAQLGAGRRGVAGRTRQVHAVEGTCTIGGAKRRHVWSVRVVRTKFLVANGTVIGVFDLKNNRSEAEERNLLGAPESLRRVLHETTELQTACGMAPPCSGLLPPLVGPRLARLCEVICRTAGTA